LEEDTLACRIGDNGEIDVDKLDSNEFV